MVRFAAGLLAVAALAAGSCATGRAVLPYGAPAGVPAAFCPQDARFCGADVDTKGRCALCGRKPVVFESVTVSWHWCKLHSAWHERACSQDDTQQCCIERASTAMIAEGATRRAKYCPECRFFIGPDHPEDRDSRCQACGKPPVVTQAALRRWFWCKAHDVWHDQRCKLPNLERTALILARTRWESPSSVGAGLPAMRNDLLVTTEWLAEQYGDPHLVVLHIGPMPGQAGRHEYADGHIPGAYLIPWKTIAVTRHRLPDEMPPVEDLVRALRLCGIDFDDRIVLYDTGEGREAARAYVALDYLGLGDRAALLDGHWKKWDAEERPVATFAPKRRMSEFVPRLRPEVLLSLNEMRDMAWLARQSQPDVALIDARCVEEYTGKIAGAGVLRPGHIPGAANLPWQRTLFSVDEPVLRSAGDLLALLDAAGAAPGRRIIAYCRTGTEAAHTYFVAKYMGYEVSLFDGSFVQWSFQLDQPVERGGRAAD